MILYSIFKKQKWLFVVIISFFISCSGKKIISYTVLQTRPYCGGARPSEEMEERSRTPLPYANKTLIYKTNKNKIDSVKTNEAGTFSVKLSRGVVTFYEAWKYYKTTPPIDGYGKDAYDKACIEEEYKKPDLIITISGIKEKYENNMSNGKCPWQQPCLKERHIPPQMRQ